MCRAVQTFAFSVHDWLLCCRLEYTLEVMKNGQIMENKAVHEKAHYTFGRSPGSDIVLEHPSSSRLHAVLVFHATDGQAFLYDAGSAHGSFLNKKQIAAKTHVPLRCSPERRPPLVHPISWLTCSMHV